MKRRIKSMPVPGLNRTLLGGPYAEKPAEAFGVKMAEEITWEHSVSIPTRDFSVPDRLDAYLGLRQTVSALVFGEVVYVGCMGGIGRTGLLLALLARMFGEEDPVGYVRNHYYQGAVETRDQVRYVMTFPMTELRGFGDRAIRAARLWDKLPAWARGGLTKSLIKLYLT